jgi:hypothetical protein
MRTRIKPVNTRKREIGQAAPSTPWSLALPGLIIATSFAMTAEAQVQDGAKNSQAPIPAEQTAAAVADPDWKVDHFSWGDPVLEGTFTSRDMGGIQMERPEQYGTRQTLTPEEFYQRATGGNRGLASLRAGDEFEGNARLQLSALDSSEVGTRTFGYTSYVVDPVDGRVPPLTPEGQERQSGRRSGQANGPFYTMDDFSYYDRCITRGVTGSILPSLYGDAMRIVQSPTSVAISYEMLHDTRIIPLDGRELPGDGVHQYMGASVGHWEGDTLVVTTRNLTDEVALGRYATSKDAVLTERFTRIDPDMINYEVTIDDPRTFEAPWTFRVTLTTQPDYQVLEYSCHEGNFFVANALRAEKRYQERVAEAKAKGEPIPERETAGGGFGGGLEIYQAPSSDEAVDINATQ